MPTTPLTGVPPRDYDPTFGGVYNVPNPIGTAADAIAGNNANMPGILDMIHGINPNYDQQENIIRDQLGGNIPADVIRQLSQMGAERGVRVGSPGSANNMAALLQSLGLTSLDMTKSGMGYAKDFTDQNYRMMSPMFVTPEQQQAAETAQSINNSAPVPRLYAEEMLRRAQLLNTGATGGTRITPPNLTTPPDRPWNPGGAPQGPATGGIFPPTAPPPSGGPAGPIYPPPSGPGSTFVAPPGFNDERVSTESATAQRLRDAGYRNQSIRTMTRSQAASILNMNPEDLDLGGPAGEVEGDAAFLDQIVEIDSATGASLRALGYTTEDIASLTREEASWILGLDPDDLDLGGPATEPDERLDFMNELLGMTEAQLRERMPFNVTSLNKDQIIDWLFWNKFGPERPSRTDGGRITNETQPNTGRIGGGGGTAAPSGVDPAVLNAIISAMFAPGNQAPPQQWSYNQVAPGQSWIPQGGGTASNWLGGGGLYSGMVDDPNSRPGSYGSQEQQGGQWYMPFSTRPTNPIDWFSGNIQGPG